MPVIVLMHIIIYPCEDYLLRGRVPRAGVAHAAPTRARALAAELLWQVFRGDLREELVFVAAADDVDLLHGDGVEPPLDERPNGTETPRRVDDVELAHALGVPVLPDRARGVDVILDLVERAERHVVQVQDGARRPDGVAHRRGRRGQAVREEPLVLVNELLEHAVLRRDAVERLDVELAQLLDVHRPPVLRNAA
jgi:hypothetical protein